MTTIASTDQKVDAKLIMPFINAVRRVLHETMNWELTFGGPRFKTQTGPEYDFSGIISLSGTLVGTVVISFHRDLAIKMVAAFVGCDLPPDGTDFADAIGELTNQIVGSAKTELGVNATISLPSVIVGKGHIVTRPHDIPCIVLPCQTAAGEFALECSIKAI
jgi:chemotaxis protein CheX